MSKIISAAYLVLSDSSAAQKLAYYVILDPLKPLIKGDRKAWLIAGY